MKRVVIPAPGSYDQLELREEPGLEPGPGELKVAVEACGVNYADVLVRMGLYKSARAFVGWPVTPGFEVAGRVVARGPGVSEPPLGSAVIAVTLFGGYASELVVPTHQAYALPERFSMEQGAAFPAVFLTAINALEVLGAPRAGDAVLVHSAAGGVGGAIVQLGRHLGLRVVGVVGSTHKVEAARALGADQVIDKSCEPLFERARSYAPEGYSVVLDANGVETLGGSYDSLAAPGRLVVYGFHTMLPRRGRGRPSWPRLALGWLRTPRFNPLDMTYENRSVMAFNLSTLFHRRELLSELMATLLERVARGQIKAPPTRAFAMEKVADAHRLLESGSSVGKLVLLP